MHPPDPAAAPLKDARYFPETGHNLNSGFREFWGQNGGLAIFGYPISEELPAPMGDQTDTVQYFERARFEYHPEALGTPGVSPSARWAGSCSSRSRNGATASRLVRYAGFHPCVPPRLLFRPVE